MYTNIHIQGNRRLRCASLIGKGKSTLVSIPVREHTRVDNAAISAYFA